MKKLATMVISSMVAFAILLGVMGTGMSSCSSKTDDSIKAAQALQDSINAIKASIQPGTKLDQLAGLPGVDWSVVTYKGVCQPTTTKLFVTIDSVTYSTNVTDIKADSISVESLGAEAAIDAKVDGTVADLQQTADQAYNNDLAKAKAVAKSWAATYSWAFFGTDGNCYSPKVSVGDAASGSFRASACGSSTTIRVARNGDSFYVTNRRPNPADAP